MFLLLAALFAGATSSFKQTTFVIGGGPDPPPTNTSYSNLHEGGVTFLHADSNEIEGTAGAELMASLCATNNLSCAVPVGSYKVVKPSKNVWGYFIHDEPNAKLFPALASTVTSIRTTYPTENVLPFINLLGYLNATEDPAKARQLYGVDTYQEYVDSFLKIVKPDILSYDNYPSIMRMDDFHYNLAFIRNSSAAAGIPFWNYIWLNSNGIGNGVGFYRWTLSVSSAYGSRGMMQWSISPCADTHNCGPKARWAPYPCFLDKHGNPFKPVYNYAKVEHAKFAVIGPLLLQLKSSNVLRIVPSRANPPVIRLDGMAGKLI